MTPRIRNRSKISCRRRPISRLNCRVKVRAKVRGRGESQTAVQSLESSSDNDNWNANGNANGNLNGNGNLNFNANENENKVDNKLDNDVDNNVDNKVDNNIENKIENTVENNVDVDVNVKVDLDLSADGLSSPVIALYDFDAKGAIVMPDVVNQTMNDGDDSISIRSTTWSITTPTTRLPATTRAAAADCGMIRAQDFSMDAKIEGGESKIDADAIGDRTNVHSSADAAINQSAFDQNITQGANIQFNILVLRSIRAAQPRGSLFCKSFHFRRCSCRQEAAGREA